MEESPSDTFASRLDSVMRKRRLRNPEVAKAVGKSTGTVSKWRGGHQAPDDDAVIGALADFLGVSKSWLRYADEVPTIRTTDTADAWGTAFREGRRSALRELRAWLESEEKRLGPEA